MPKDGPRIPIGYEITFEIAGIHKVLDANVAIEQVHCINGTTIPVRGTVSQFFIEEHLPDGLTSGEVNAMPKDQADAITAKTVYKAVPFGDPVHVEPSLASIVVNDLKPISFFRIQFADDVYVRDFSDPAVSVYYGDRRLTPNSSTQTTHATFTWLVALVILNVAIVVVRRILSGSNK